MAQLVKAENRSKDQLVWVVELQSSAEKVYDFYKKKCYEFPKIMPLVLLKVELVSGERNCVGSVRRWTFVDDKCGSLKDTVEAINDEEKSITWALLDGEVLKKLYKSLKVEYQFTAKDKGCTATVTLTFEKKGDGFPEPAKCGEVIKSMLLAVDAYLLTH
ncbi:allergen Pet c 1-like [Syzygium oleosum]|uniref:allergen Pet c 1-like n=1 Tax=Syzygium oleosum TaxID=219896 RepID=UPI0011D1BAB2|nr:allergen Pet c 1-like [Syzygium oleosum]